MRLLFLWVGLGFAVGIVLEKYGKIPVFWPACVLGAGLILLWFLCGRRLFLPLFILCLGCAGILWARLDAHVPANAVRNFTSPERITLRGVVDTLPEMKTRGKKTTVSLVLKAKSISRQENGRWKFRKVSGLVQVFLLQSPVLPQVGDELRLYGTLSAPRTVLNPGEFDYKSFLAQKNIHAIFQTIGKKSVRVTKVGNSWAPARMISETRRYLATLIDKLYKTEESAILKALVLGLRSDVSPEVRNHFFRSGTIHLLAISGLNITMIAGSFFLIFLFFRMPKKLTVVLTMVIVALYVPLAGAGIPVQRAGMMALMVLAAMLLGRPVHLLNALCVSFFLILCLQPKSLWNIGFQLSFLSVLSLIAILPLFPRHRILSLSIGGSLAVLIGTSPVVLYYFSTFSPAGVIANLAAIPIFDAALLSALFSVLFCWVPILGSFWVAVSSGIVSAGLAWIGWLAIWRFGCWFFVKPEAWQLWAYYGALGLLLGITRLRFRLKKIAVGLCWVCWGVAAVSMLRVADPAGFCLTVLASGREPVLHARFSNGADWLVNTGRNFPSDQGERLVLPYLRQLGIKQLDGILLTDLQKKHRGGLEAILRDISVRRILFPRAKNPPPDFETIMRSFRREKVFLKTGSELDFGGEKIAVLEADGNGAAILIESGARKILFISRLGPAVADMIERAGPGAVIVPFLKKPAADNVLRTGAGSARRFIIAGADPGVLTSLEQSGIRYFDLSATGAIKITAGQPGLRIAPWRSAPP